MAAHTRHTASPRRCRLRWRAGASARPCVRLLETNYCRDSAETHARPRRRSRRSWRLLSTKQGFICDLSAGLRLLMKSRNVKQANICPDADLQTPTRRLVIPPLLVSEEISHNCLREEKEKRQHDPCQDTVSPCGPESCYSFHIGRSHY